MIYSTKLHCDLKHILLESKMGGHGLITYASTSCHGETTPCPQVKNMDSRSFIEYHPVFFGSFIQVPLQLLIVSYRALAWTTIWSDTHAFWKTWTSEARRQAWLVLGTQHPGKFLSFGFFSSSLPYIFQHREQCRDYCSGFSSADSFVWTKPEEAPENQICFCKVRNIFSQWEKTSGRCGHVRATFGRVTCRDE